MRPNVDEEGDRGKHVVIDVETGDFEIDADEMAACDRLAERRPDTKVSLKRVGSRYPRTSADALTLPNRLHDVRHGNGP